MASNNLAAVCVALGCAGAVHAAQEASLPLCVPTPEPLQRELVRKPGSVDEQLEGLIRVQIEIAPDGSVRDAVILDSTNHELDGYALQSVRHWRYPARESACRLQSIVRYRSDE